MMTQVHLVIMRWDGDGRMLSNVMCGATNITHAIDVAAHISELYEPVSGEELCVHCTSQLALCQLVNTEL